ncbi:vomeronasal type-2 receptor 26-like [Discoglossus pictus]
MNKVVSYLSYQDAIGKLLSSVSMILFSATAAILWIFTIHRSTPVVKANNQYISYIILISLMVCFLCSFLFIGRPINVTCVLRQTAFGVTFSVVLSSVLAKTFTVVLAFKATRPGNKWRVWVTPKVSFYIVISFSLTQVLICVTWLAISPPFQDINVISEVGKVIIECNEGSLVAFYSVLGYLGLLAAVSLSVAFLARTLPDSFNEAKYITFSMLVFCSVWIAFIPAYLSTKGKYMVAVEIFAILASAFGILGCIFIPKCYIILLRPDINTRRNILGK